MPLHWPTKRPARRFPIAVPVAASTARRNRRERRRNHDLAMRRAATRGLNSAKKSRASCCVLYIFQFPAITGLRARATLAAPHSEHFHLRQRFHARQFLARQKFQRGAAARGDMRNFARPVAG